MSLDCHAAEQLFTSLSKNILILHWTRKKFYFFLLAAPLKFKVVNVLRLLLTAKTEVLFPLVITDPISKLLKTFFSQMPQLDLGKNSRKKKHINVWAFKMVFTGQQVPIYLQRFPTCVHNLGRDKPERYNISPTIQKKSGES